MPPPPLVVAIVGGGIGGLYAALSLHHHCKDYGVEIHVYEQAAEYKEIGAGVGIGINAARLLHLVGIGEAMNDISGRRNGIWISFRRWDNGGEIVTVNLDDKQTIRPTPVHRAEFLELLLNAIKERNAATLHTNKRCIKVEEIGDATRLRFQDGTTAVADLVVGCDGIHSTIRGQFATDSPNYSGRVAYRGLIPIKEIESWWPHHTYSISWLGPDKHFLVFPISQNKTLNIVAFVTTKVEDLGGLQESWTSTGQRSDLAKEFEGFNESVRKVIDLMSPTPSKWLLNDRSPLEKWVFMEGKIVLMGDAAHAMLPHQGAGAGQSIEDGYILGRALQFHLKSCQQARDGGLKRWMNIYEAVRLPRAQRAQATARQAGDVYEMQTKEMQGKTFEECVPIVRDNLKDRMKWVWHGDIDAAFEKAVNAATAESIS